MWNHPESHPGELLRARFMNPLGLSASALAARCGIPRSRLSEILSGKRRISADTALRLAAVFRMEPEAWLALQSQWDLGQAAVPEGIVPFDLPGFVIGPDGATPIVPRRPTRPTLSAPPDRLRALAAEPPAEPYEPRVHEEVRYPDGTRAMVVK